MNGFLPYGYIICRAAAGYLLVIHAFLMILAAACSAGEALPKVTAKSFLKTYPPISYQGQNQVYDVVKDHRGVLFAGNNVNGVLEYDGIHWRTIPLSNNNTAYSLAVGNSGQVFVAGSGDIGFLSQVNGATIYESLLDKIPSAHRTFGRAQVECIGDSAYFNTGNAVLLWQDNGFFVIENPSGAEFDELFPANGAIYTSDRNGTIFKIQGRTAEPIFQEQPDIYGGYIFKNDYNMPSINLVLPLDSATILIGTYFRGFITFDGQQLAPFETEADSFLVGNMGYSATRLNNGEFAVSTVDQGVIVIDRQGRLKAWFRQENGLTENTVYGIFQDRHNGLWITTDFGLNQVLYPSPFTLYDRFSGLAGQVRKTTELNGSLYVATSQGAFKSRSPVSPLGLRFERISGINPSETGAVEAMGNTVLFGSIFGLFQVIPAGEGSPQDDRVLAVPWLQDKDCRFIEVSRKYPGIVYAGTAYDGIFILRFKDNQWTREGHIPLNDAVFFGAEDMDGRLWATGMNSGMYRIDFSVDGFEAPEIKNYYTNQGLPEGYYAASIVDRDIFLYSDEIFLSYNREADKFVPDRRFFDDGSLTGILDQAPDGSVWFTKGRPRRLGLAVKQSATDTYRRLSTPFQRFNDYQIRNFGYDGNNRTYLGAAQSLLVYDAGIPFPADTPFSTLIRKLTVNGTPIFGPGAANASAANPVRLKYSENTLRFDYAGLFTDVAFGNRYAVQLEGLNPEFSEWDEAAYKEYTNLEPGQYRFLVKSRNIYATQSDTAAFSFRILPPWWETWWFYLAEISLLVLLVMASFLLNRSGEVSRFTKILTFVTLVVVFESIMFVAEPFAEAFGGGVPVVQLLLNIGLAILLQPSQELMSKLLIERRKKRRYKISFNADGQWQGGAHILTRVRNIEDVVPWCDTFKKEYGDIDRKYRRYVLNDWELDSEEKKDLLAEMEDLLTVLVVFRRQILPGRPDRFSSLGIRGDHSFTVRIHPRHWLGQGVVPDSSPFTLDAFTRWLHNTVTDMTEMLDTYASALEDQVLSEEETNRLLGQTEAMICDMLSAMYDIHMSFDD